jgi:hypothetical protein
MKESQILHLKYLVVYNNTIKIEFQNKNIYQKKSI